MMDRATIAESLLHEGTGIRFQVSGRSMLPVLKNGDEVEVLPLAQQDVFPGDIVLYRSADGGLRVHRLVRFQEGAYLMAGDGHCSGVESVSGADLMGRVCVRIRGDSRIGLSTRRCRLKGRMRYRFRSLRLLLRRIRNRLPGCAGQTCAT